MKFITFEGPEGSGKTTLSRMLHQHLQESGKPSVITREPGGPKEAEIIRKILIEKHNFLPESELLLFNAARLEHWKKFIQPNLDNGNIVICDRFLDSTVAYQGYGLGIDIGLIHQLHNLFMPKAHPDITFLLMLDPEEGLRRAKEKNHYELLPTDFHKKVHGGFVEISKQKRVVVIDATLPLQRCFDNIIDVVKTAVI